MKRKNIETARNFAARPKSADDAIKNTEMPKAPKLGPAKIDESDLPPPLDLDAPLEESYAKTSDEQAQFLPTMSPKAPSRPRPQTAAPSRDSGRLKLPSVNDKSGRQ
jgi:hypothetical protein